MNDKLTATERRFWNDVYLASVISACTTTEASKKANNAVTHLRNSVKIGVKSK